MIAAVRPPEVITEMERQLQRAVTVALKLSGMPERLWGEVTVRVEAGQVVLPVRFSVTIK